MAIRSRAPFKVLYDWDTKRGSRAVPSSKFLAVADVSMGSKCLVVSSFLPGIRTGNLRIDHKIQNVMIRLDLARPGKKGT